MKNFVLKYTDEASLLAYCKEENFAMEHPSLLIQVFTSLHSRESIEELLHFLSRHFPYATIIGATTDGEIANGRVELHATILNFTFFEKTTLSSMALASSGAEESFQTGKTLASSLATPQTKLLLLFSDGMTMNGEQLLKGIYEEAPSLTIAGGMAGDYAHFKQTFVFTKEHLLSAGVVGVAFEGEALRLLNDYNYNWQKIGKSFKVTKAKYNRLYELDGASPVKVYTEYLGKEVAKQLPAIGVEFPLIYEASGMEIARAVLQKHDDGSLSFSGDIPEGSEVYFGYGNPEQILKNAQNVTSCMKNFQPEAIFVYSCMARRRFVGNGINQELAPLETLAPMAGFFTYGEFFSHQENLLLNETLTILGLSEKPLPQKRALPIVCSEVHQSGYHSVNALIHLVNKTSEEMMQQRVFAQANLRFEQLFEASGDGILVIKEGVVMECNRSMLSLLGYEKKKEDFLAIPLSHWVVDKAPKAWIDTIESQMRASGEKHLLEEVACQRANGEVFWAEVMFTQMDFDNERLLYALFRDISKRKEMEQELVKQRDALYYKAYHDDLTGLPNRKAMMQFIDEAIEEAKEREGTFALLFLDVDKLKLVNDSLGHDVGDELIILTAKRIAKSLAKGNIVGRLGGDEFLILLKNIEQKGITTQVEKILGAIREVMILGNRELYTSASIGVALYPKDAKRTPTLLKYADSAMYEAKENGSDQYRFYSGELTKKAHAQVKIAQAFRQAIRNKEFVVYYQPQVDAQTNEVLGVEALIRWKHPKKGFLNPQAFLEEIKRENLLGRLDKWVMNHAMKEILCLRQSGLEPGRLALNISMSQIENRKWEQHLMRSMNRLKFHPEWLELEVTETEIMKHPERVLERLTYLQEQNIHIAIDDFGTGYSSLLHLKKMSVDTLKMDKAFIEDVPYDKDAMAMVTVMIALAHKMQLKVLAEGVETQEQLAYLQEEGCDVIQGYYYAKPMSIETLSQWLKERQTSPDPSA